MKKLLIGFVAVVAIMIVAIVVVIAIGYSLPVEHSASRSIRIDRPVGEVYRAVRDLPNHPTWRPGLDRIEILSEENGRVRFREYGWDDPVTYELSEDIPERRLVTTILDKDLGYSGSWTYDLSANAGSTRLTITENGEVTNPAFRFMSRYVFGYTAGIDAYLRALASHMGTPAEPQDVNPAG